MTRNWLPAPAWRVDFDEGDITLTLHRPDGSLAATLAPYDVPPEQRGGGWLQTLRVGSAHGLDAALWISSRGRMRQGADAVRFATTDGTPVELWNGKSDGWRRTHRRGRITIGGRAYEVHHRSRRRTELVAEGVPRATLRRKGLGWGSSADDLARHVVRLEAPALDARDELAIVLAISALGPAGRPGLLANSSGGFSL